MSGTQSDIINVVSGVVHAENRETTQKSYDDWTKNYDEDLGNVGYFVPKRAVESFVKYTKHVKVEKVLDVGAGTGFVGQYLRTDAKYEGVIDILDANIEMLYLASKKDLNFRNIIRHWVEGKLPVHDESYDVMMCVGSFAPNHVPVTSLPGIFKCVRKGGLLIFTTRVQSPGSYKQEFDELLARMELDAAIKRLDTYEVVHFQNAEKKINSAIYVYQKL